MSLIRKEFTSLPEYCACGNQYIRTSDLVVNAFSRTVARPSDHTDAICDAQPTEYTHQFADGNAVAFTFCDGCGFYAGDTPA